MPGIERVTAGCKPFGDMVGQRQIHVVAAHQQMVADGQPLQLQLSFGLGDFDQCQVGRAAADVTHQQAIADVQELAPAFTLRGEPGVHGRLRFLQQDQVGRQAGGQRGLARQFAGGGIERGGNRQDHSLLGHGSVRMLGLPGGDQVIQIMAGGGDRRDLGHLARRVPRQNRLPPIDTTVAQPGLGRSDRALRRIGRSAPR